VAGRVHLLEGEMSEWLKEHAWKACIRGNADRGFESHSLRSPNNSLLAVRVLSGHPYSQIQINRFGEHVVHGGQKFMKILLVDDRKDVLDTMGEILEICHNHNVQGANSGKEALKFIKRKKYDLVVMDLALPVMNGLEVISKIRKNHPKLNIVVLTGISCNDLLREKLKELDVQQIFVKPKGIHELLQYIKQQASKHSAA
jgi:CheY-like chemotaxis protein